MAKAYRIPDYRRMYPEGGEEVIAVLRTTERKMQYQEYDLKTEQTIISQEDQSITVIPSREDSLERLAHQGGAVCRRIRKRGRNHAAQAPVRTAT